MASRLLHGTLHVTIYEANHLSGGLIHQVVDGLLVSGKLLTSVEIGGTRVGNTRPLKHSNSSNPRWNELIHIYCAHKGSEIVFTLREDKPTGESVVGQAYLPVTDILGGLVVDTWLDILNDHHKPIHQGSKIHVQVQFVDVNKDMFWGKGIGSPTFPGVPFTFFSQREQCKVTLYQDSHVSEDFAPKIVLDSGKYYEQHRCWEDIFDAISDAKHLIYITGWSVFTDITLVRDPRRPKPGGNMTLGELLKKKAEEGVRVLMLVWDDWTSFPVIKNAGQMDTHDEKTASYFRDSKVHCVLCLRDPEAHLSVPDGRKIGSICSHHQKIVVVDSALPDGNSGKRRIVSFVGGLDLCDGRYDSPSHSLFRTLGTSHHNDFHQPNFSEASIKKGGPREPWHDIHSKLEGVAAWDVLYNFEQRWRKQGKGGLLLDLQGMSNSFVLPSPITTADNQETWNVQVFRSIDSGAATGFPESLDEAARAGLRSWRDILIDRSIQDAYIHAIRRAKKFIYIENQYFLGSSFDWKKSDINPADIGAEHLIPKELSLKIVSKIEKGERFTVYVVMPMWPEGDPGSGPMQAILDWQRRTMEMMYTDITQALKVRGISANPKDYLSFFCLGNRELKRTGEYEPEQKPKPGTSYAHAQAARRFMIYVHAKMMIVDDEYIIVGSANINERSMDGGRDSEIAMGAYQPHQIAQGNKPARGQIHGFRMSLWYEHLGLLDNTFANPESIECMKKVNQIADKYWKLYTSETLDQDLPGHLLSYPIGITKEGEVLALPEYEFFPDTTARVLGKKSKFLLPEITTRAIRINETSAITGEVDKSNFNTTLLTGTSYSQVIRKK